MIKFCYAHEILCKIHFAGADFFLFITHALPWLTKLVHHPEHQNVVKYPVLPKLFTTLWL